VFHPDLVGVLGFVEVVREGLASAGFVGLEQLLVGLDIGEQVDLVAVLEEDPIVGVELRKRIVVLGALAEVTEEPLEDVGHQVPRGPHIEGKAVAFKSARTATQLLVFLDDRHVCPRVGEIAGRRQPTKSTADDDDLFAVDRREVAVVSAFVAAMSVVVLVRDGGHLYVK